MIIVTALNHFDEDIRRAKAILSHAKNQPDGELKDDLSRSSWMMAVGALDAYFCDAYGDLIARTLRAKQIQGSGSLPSKLKILKVPALVVLDNKDNKGWMWRMVARDLIEKDNVLSIEKIKNLFSVFFREGEKIFAANSSPLEKWILHKKSKVRLFGITSSEFRKLTNKKDISEQKRESLTHLEKRFEKIFQRRHDCIHNCDRPKIAIQIRNITTSYVEKVIDDIEFIVHRCTENIRDEYPFFLTNLNFSGVTRNAVKA